MPRNREQILTEWLVLNSQSGNADALEELLKLWYPKLLGYARRHTGSTALADDVVQETLLTVARRVRTLRDPAAFPRWLYQILNRRGADALRRLQRERRFSRLEDTAEPSVRENNDTGIALHQAFATLSSDAYQIVHMRFLVGLSLREIASVLEIPVGTVKSRLHNARATIKQLLDDDND